MRSKSRNSLFLTLCLVLTVGLIWSYSVFERYFASGSEGSDRIHWVERELREEKLRRVLAESRMRDLSIEVSQILPDKKIAGNEALKNLKYALREPAAIPVDLSGVLFERGKKLFNQKKFKEAFNEFNKLRDEYPLSVHRVESAFLAGESSFLAGDFEATVGVADLMVEQFPDHDLTGFMLIRLGQINENSGRYGEASEIYKAVSSNFKNPTLVDQAKRMMRSLDSL